MARPSSTLTTSSTLAWSKNQKVPVSPLSAAALPEAAWPWATNLTSATKRSPPRQRAGPEVQAEAATRAESIGSAVDDELVLAGCRDGLEPGLGGQGLPEQAGRAAAPGVAQKRRGRRAGHAGAEEGRGSENSAQARRAGEARVAARTLVRQVVELRRAQAAGCEEIVHVDRRAGREVKLVAAVTHRIVRSGRRLVVEERGAEVGGENRIRDDTADSARSRRIGGGPREDRAAAAIAGLIADEHRIGDLHRRAEQDDRTTRLRGVVGEGAVGDEPARARPIAMAPPEVVERESITSTSSTCTSPRTSWIAPPEPPPPSAAFSTWQPENTVRRSSRRTRFSSSVPAGATPFAP